MKKLYLFLFLIIMLVPLGLLSENPAWGEWENDYYQKILGYIPKGMMQNSFFEAPVPDYSIAKINDIGSYYLSAFIGVVLIFGIFFILKRVIKVER